MKNARLTGAVAFVAALTMWAMTAVSAQQWPSFRGAGSSGVAAAATPPVSWDLAGSKNVAWSTPIPGLAHSSPVVWGDRVFLTTSINTTTEAPDLTSKAVELEGNRDMGRHQWKLYSLERRTGRVLWEKVVYEGVPRVKRHGKASHASASPATNGSVVVVSMGSEGLYCFDMEGTLKWKKDLGVLDVGWVDEPDNQWGPGSSPIIDGDLVIFQDDRQRSRSTSHLIRIYFTSEDGVVYVVRAGRAFELMASNDMREVCMATPAIANDMMIVRTRTRLYGLVAAR